MPYRIPFNRPFLAGKELDYIQRAVKEGHTSGNGAFTQRAEELLCQLSGSKQVLLTNSASAALEMAALLCEVEPGDEVIMPSFTFVTCANAFVMRGARPVFVDIRADTLNLDESLLEAAITPRTKAILAVHYAGVSCEMDPILQLGRARGLRVVEDAAQGLGAAYKGSSLGTLGDLGVYSFHETKNVICGEGGALVVNDPALLQRAEILREKGTDRTRFFRGEVDRYTWQDVGSSWIPSDILAAFLCAQLEEADRIMARRREIWARYREGLSELEDRGDLRLPQAPDYCQGNGHLFYVLLESESVRRGLIDHLGRAGILAVFHFVPLHTSPGGRRWAGPPRSLPVTDDVARRLLRLPLYFELSLEEQEQVISSVRAFFA